MEHSLTQVIHVVDANAQIYASSDINQIHAIALSLVLLQLNALMENNQPQIVDVNAARRTQTIITTHANKHPLEYTYLSQYVTANAL